MSDNAKPSLAIVMFGLTKSVDQTLESFNTHLFQVLKNNGISFSIFQHTYIFRESYMNAWSGESITEYPNEKYLLIDAHKREVEYQEDVIKTINFEEYYKHPTTWSGEVKPEKGRIMIRNMILGLRSRKRAFQLLEPELDRFSHVLFIRPDLYILNDFDVDILSYSISNSCFIPGQDMYLGCNDKILLCEAIRSKEIGYLFDSILPYSKEKRIVSELFLLDMLKHYNMRPLLIDLDYEMKRIQ